MTERQVEDLFSRYDVRALPVVDDQNEVIGLVTYKEVAAAKQRLWNKQQKRLEREAKQARDALLERNTTTTTTRINGDRIDEMRRKGKEKAAGRKLGSALKGWMKQHVSVVEASTTMAEVEAILLANDGKQ
jgi:CBS-domain-containing membrane protein